MKRIIITALLAIFCISNMQAGKNKGKVITPRPTPNVAIGGGTSMPSNNAKDKAFLSNSTAISIDASIPITKRGWGPNGNWFGVNIGGSYNFGGKGGFGTSPNPYAISGQTSSMVADRGKDPADPGFRMGAGPQANFHFGKLMVSPMLLGEYFAMTRKEMSSVQTTQYNGQNYDFTLATLPETKTSGFAVTPKLRLQYMFSNRFGLFADASYTAGPKVETQITKLIPNGAANQQGTYEIQALQNASYVKGETKTTRYSATGINFGVVIGLGRNGSKGWNGIAETADATDASKTSTSCSCLNSQTGSVQFPSGSGPSANIGSVLNIPYDASNYTKNLTISYNPHPYETSYSSSWATRIEVKINGNSSFSIVSPAGMTNNYNLTAPGAMVVSFNELSTGTNIIKIIAYCGGGTVAPPCDLGTVTVNVAAPPAPSSGTITLVKECCTETSRIPPYATRFTGQVKFKMTGTVVNAVLEISSPAGVVYEPFINGGTTACYSKPAIIKIVENVSHASVIGSTINGLPSYSYKPKFDVSCLNRLDMAISIDKDLKVALPENPFNPFNPWDIDWVITYTEEHFVRGRRGLFMNGTDKDGGKIQILAPAEIDEETGKIFLTGTPEITKTVNGKTSKIKSNYKPTQKRDYVGHVTLLK